MREHQPRRHLITTADERTWKFDGPVLFLGEWCRLYDRRHVWSAMDAEVARPYGLGAGQKERDSTYIQSLSGQILKELAEALNTFHGTQHGQRYWEIVLGHWLQRYVATVFNRFSTLEQALREHDVSGEAVLDSDAYSLATNDTQTFLWACDNDVWNHVLYAKILDYMGYIKSGIDLVPFQGETGFALERVQQNTSAIRTLLRAAKKVWHKFGGERDAFIINSYLSPREEIQLQISLGQCPQLWQSPSLESVRPDPGMRQHFRIDSENHSGFERFVRDQLGQVLPTCYLEGYKQLVRQVESLPWPAAPKFIFTSNNFDTDEIFKVWTARKVEKGVPYFTGQHGNNYGTHFYHGNSNWPDRTAVDKFFSWGWGGESHVVPAFNFKVNPRNALKYAPDGGLLLIEVCLYHRITSWDGYFEFGSYQEHLFCFAEKLPEHIRQELTVRLHLPWKKFRWSDEQRWKDRNPDIEVEIGIKPIRQLIARNRLVIHAYDSTGILETLAQNIPTLCFLPGGLDYLLPGARPYYELLRKAGILADSPERATELVALYWDDVGRWWWSEETQNARKSFCEQYSKVEKRPARKMKQLLTAQLS